MDEDKAINFSNKVIETVKKIPLSLIFSVFCICLLMLYWFIAIFLFHNTFYTNNIIGITLIFSFAFSFTWFILNFLLSLLSVLFIDAITKQQSDNSSVFFVNAFVSIIYLCAVILVFHVLKKYYYPNWNFDTFLAMTYLYICVRILWVGSFLIYQKYKEHKKTKVLMEAEKIS